ncbi:Oligo-1,6-glucosidase [compost metagenome]
MNAGFTTGTPWLKVDERYPDINVQKELEDPGSIFHHYRKLIALRKEYAVFVEGVFSRLDEGHPDVFAYARTGNGETLVVVSNFSGKEFIFRFQDNHWTDLFSGRKEMLLIGNTANTPALAQELQLSPYASYMWLVH